LFPNLGQEFVDALLQAAQKEQSDRSSNSQSVPGNNKVTSPLTQRVSNPRNYLVNRKWDREFFTGMALLLLATVLIGFWPSYFSAGMIKAPLPSKLVHFHGAVFTLWMVLFVVQVGLIAARKVKVHRALGLAGFGLAVVMVVLGLLTATAAVRRSLSGHLPGDALFFYVVPVSDLVLFAPLIFCAYWMRSKLDFHKRLALIATIALMGAPLFRFPFAAMHASVFAQSFVMFGFLLLVVGYDLLSLHRVHRATLWSSAYFVFIHLVRVPLGSTAAWHSFANFMVGLG
jgi:hypothetical protein